MPMTFSIDVVQSRLIRNKLSVEGSEQEQRERLALFTESKYKDFVEAWEIRTGHPWTEMTNKEARQLMDLHPETRCNPGVISRLATKDNKS